MNEIATTDEAEAIDAPAGTHDAWIVEPKPYYSWMWADAAIRPAPLDLGHGGAEEEPTVWSPWLGRQAAIQDLQLYQTADNFGRPVEMRIAAARGGLSRDAVQGRLLPGSKRFLSKFSSMDEAIDYLSRGGATLSRDWYKAGNASTSKAAPAYSPAAGEENSSGESQAGESSSTSLAPSAPVSEQKLGAAARQEDGDDGSGMSMSTLFGYLGYIGFVPCLAFAGWIGFRLFRRDQCRDADIVTSAGEEDTAGDSEDTEEDPGDANPWQAFIGEPRAGEMRRLLLFAEGGAPRLPPLPPDAAAAPAGPAQRPIAEAEVERILATREPSGIFGNVDAAGRKQEFRRLLRLLHPDKGLVSGERATLALRRMVEAYRALAAEP